MEATFAECSDNPYVNRCDSSHQCAEVASNSHGISGSAGTGHNDSSDNVESIDPKSITNAGKIDKNNIIHGVSIHRESSITLREQPTKPNMFDPSAMNQINESRQNEKRNKNPINNVTKKRKVANDSPTNKKGKSKNPKVPVDNVKTDLTEEYMCKLKEYEKLFELPPITKNRPRNALDFDRGYFKALRKYVKSKYDISVANR